MKGTSLIALGILFGMLSIQTAFAGPCNSYGIFSIAPTEGSSSRSFEGKLTRVSRFSSGDATEVETGGYKVTGGVTLYFDEVKVDGTAHTCKAFIVNNEVTAATADRAVQLAKLNSDSFDRMILTAFTLGMPLYGWANRSGYATYLELRK